MTKNSLLTGWKQGLDCLISPGRLRENSLLRTTLTRFSFAFWLLE